jgi:hypothetical protein
MKLKVEAFCPTKKERTVFNVMLYYATNHCPICKRRIGLREGMCEATVITSVDRNTSRSYEGTEMK